MDATPAALVDWFEAHGGIFDRSALTFAPLPGQGYGALARRDLAEGDTLFAIPRALTLSTRTARLPDLVGQDAWKRLALDVGWAGLIVTMMWEGAQGSASPWSTYLASLPTSFDTPMFWSQEEIEELRGTAVVDKIGRDQAETDYREKALPLIETRPDLFQPQHRDTHYALAHYHLMGSRILSRSFHVERWKRARTDHPGDKDGGLAGDASMDVDVAVDVDREQEAPADEGAGRDADADAEELDVLVDDSDDSDDEEDPADIAMVPMADMLNARFGSENAKLFYEEHSLLMNVTKPIPKGEQIWNTYGDPPNSDLLRRYGHVDLVPLPDGEFGNPADIVEVPADFAVASLTHQRALQSSDPFTERVDWWLEEGGDDVFILEYPDELPDDFISFLRLLSISEPEWQKTKLKSKLPKPKLDSEVLSVAVDVLQRRLSAYPTSIDEDRQALSAGTLNANKLHAVVVRLGEKRILQAALVKAKAKLDALSSPGPKGTAGARKRKLEGGEDKKSGRKAKR